eukprot:6067311-Lingulodinium_polyedra.AAC.1
MPHPHLLGHVHDRRVAEHLGLAAASIEGLTHSCMVQFSVEVGDVQLAPHLLDHLQAPGFQARGR